MLESGDHPDRLARSVCVRTRDSIDNVAMAAMALHAAMPAAEAPTGTDATLSPVAGDVGAHAHQMSRIQDLAVTMSPRRSGVIR
jgi:hypothetical protein